MERHATWIKNSSKTFQALMNKVLWGAEAYANTHHDDIITTSDSWEEHLSHICDILKSPTWANLTARASKTQFAREETKYFGFLEGNHKIALDPDKAEAIENVPIST